MDQSVLAGLELGLVETPWWGKIVNAEVGMRAEFAEISALVRPYTDTGYTWFPEEEIRANYPGVRIFNLGEISRVIKDRKLRLLKREPAPPRYQYLLPGGDLVWGLDGMATGVALPIAAEYPGETLPKHGLVKVRYQDDEIGKVYAYWRRDDGDRESRQDDRQQFYAALAGGGIGHHTEVDEAEED